jgi:glutaryl-CoA dehydrogenase (non-decarboxylating)
MIDFSISEEHQLLEQSIREWGAREVMPYIRENDRKHHFDRERILGGMAKLGLLGISVPQEYGGAGMDYIALGIASEELEYLDTSLRVIMSVHAGLNCLSLLSWGTEDQKQRYLVPQAQGKKISGYGLTEPAAGSDARDSNDGDEEGRHLPAERREELIRWPMSPTTSWSSPGPTWRKRSRAIRPA